jgi:hypothetical protein
MKRMLLGYDAESASVLSKDEGTFLSSCASSTRFSIMLFSLVYRMIDKR